MCYAECSGHILALTETFEIIHLAAGLVNVEFSVTAHERHTGAVITAVFQPVKPLDKNFISGLVADVSNYSTHILSFSM